MKPTDAKQQPRTQAVVAGRTPHANHGVVNPPVYHASTVLFASVAALEAASKQPFAGTYYGRHGTPTTFAFEEAVAQLDSADKAIAVSSGMAAISTTLLALLSSGDHLLMVDSAYQPTRGFCDKILKRMGVEVDYYPPLCGADIQQYIRPNTKLIFTESPGSLSFEVQDIPAICTIAKQHNVLVAMDNTWATPLYFAAKSHGVDVCIHAATKYLVGHSDAMMGTISCSEALYPKLKGMAVSLGNCPGPDDLYLAQRGLRTLAVRLQAHQTSALQLATWLQQQPEIERVLYPALPDDLGYPLWQRDFTGASGLFAIIIKPPYQANISHMLDAMQLFGMGYSWGGYESLILPAHIQSARSVTRWPYEGRTLRLHIGLEAVEDLQADLQAGLGRLQPDR